VRSKVEFLLGIGSLETGSFVAIEETSPRSARIDRESCTERNQNGLTLQAYDLRRIA
jgi:hypothetical protein